MTHPSSEYPRNKTEFEGLVATIQANHAIYREPKMYAVGRPVMADNELASMRYPVVNGGQDTEEKKTQNLGTATILMYVLELHKHGLENVVNVQLEAAELDEVLRYFSWVNDDHFGNVMALRAARLSIPTTRVILTMIFDDIPIQGVEDATLKLYAMSHRLEKPNSLNLDGMFGALPNVAWEMDKPLSEKAVDRRLLEAAFGGRQFTPTSQDKFPFYIHRINGGKMGVRMPDDCKVRLGAYLGDGTVVMPGASYVNYNAGTLGKSMVEGRISSGATVGDGTAVGGGASILGILSGGNTTPIKVGKNCLLGANSTLGIWIGHGTIISAGVTVMPDTPVWVHVEGHENVFKQVKAIELTSISGVTFFQNRAGAGLEIRRIPANTEALAKLDSGGSLLNHVLHDTKSRADKPND